MTSRRSHALVLFVGSVLAIGSSAVAHHSFSAWFDANAPVRLSGAVTRIEWTNPHTSVHLDVRASDGQIRSWAIEGASPATLTRLGMTRTTLKIGDTLTVDGYTARNGAPFVDGRRLMLPDGRVIDGITRRE